MANFLTFQTLLFVISLCALACNEVVGQESSPYDRDAALAMSQQAIGSQVQDHRFTNQFNQSLSLADLSGRPLLISMIFTSCHHICPATTQRIKEAVANAEAVLGDESFDIVSVGFDVQNDTPMAMRAFARKQSIDAANWHFLSAAPEVISAFSAEIGFQFFASPRGFDHINQITLVDRNGKIYRQVYGMDFELPALVEPLKQLVLNRPESAHSILSSLVDRVRLFCTVYDASSGRYKIDYSLFIEMAVGLTVLLSVLWYVYAQSRRSRRP